MGELQFFRSANATNELGETILPFKIFVLMSYRVEHSASTFEDWRTY